MQFSSKLVGKAQKNEILATNQQLQGVLISLELAKNEFHSKNCLFSLFVSALQNEIGFFTQFVSSGNFLGRMG